MCVQMDSAVEALLEHFGQQRVVSRGTNRAAGEEVVDPSEGGGVILSVGSDLVGEQEFGLLYGGWARVVFISCSALGCPTEPVNG